MKCHQCNQDSIEIHDKHIICEICGLDIDVSNMLGSHLYDLFFYNENLNEAKKLGIESYTGNLKNPYSTNADQFTLHNPWEQGYAKEKLDYDYSALSLSSEKIESELRADLEKARAEIQTLNTTMNSRKNQVEEHIILYRNLESKINTFIFINYTTILNFCAKLLRIKILGRFIRKDVDQFKQEYKKFYEDSWDFPGE